MVVPNPDIVGRREILRGHLRTVPLAPAVDLKGSRARRAGLLGADPMNRSTKLHCLPPGGNRARSECAFDDAKDRLMRGDERRRGSNARRMRERGLVLQLSRRLYQLPNGGGIRTASSPKRQSSCRRVSCAWSRRWPFTNLPAPFLATYGWRSVPKTGGPGIKHRRSRSCAFAIRCCAMASRSTASKPAPRLRAYPRETVIAEKLQAMVALGRANSCIKISVIPRSCT